jgi:histidinol-phosphate/aromatic aminotransferase/cobyric acid decarboxylase-like protein
MNQFTKTVYSICYPETKECLQAFLQNPDIHTWYQETWSKKQDSIHHEFFEQWKNWVSPAIDINWLKFNHSYPTAGSSEAIREQIVYLNSKGKNIVVFEGEYEGYEAISGAVGQKVKKIKREFYFAELMDLDKETDVFFISQPSSIDGNFWLDFDSFMTNTNKLGISVYVDLAYVGASIQAKKLNLDYPNIEGIFFSLSKVYGVYYHRIGGVFLKKPNSLLYGNMWFKNIFAMKYGQSLMAKYPIHYFDDKLSLIQDEALEHLAEYSLKKSDVYIIATTKNEEKDWQQEYIRNRNNPDIRVCLSPLMEKLLFA